MLSGLSVSPRIDRMKEPLQQQAARERPIAFAAPMIRAILKQQKTQTRRSVKPQPTNGDASCLVCPFGLPGDRLWVRERWSYRRQLENPRARDGGPIVYA